MSQPFDNRIESGHRILTVPYYAQVRVRTGFAWKEVFNGSHWTELGALPEQTTFQFSFPMDLAVQVRAQGKTWTLRPSKLPMPRIQWRRLFNPFWIRSLMYHVSILVLLLLGMHLPEIKQFIGVAPTQTASTPEAEEAAAAETAEESAAARLSEAAFKGDTYTHFQFQYVDKTGTAEERLSNLLGNGLGQLKGTVNTYNGGPRSLGTLKGGNPGFAVGKGTKAGNRMAPDFVYGNSQRGAALSEADRALLKKRFAELAYDFELLYNRALMQDPSLSVTVSFEATVASSGVVRLSKFNAEGTYTPKGLEFLKSGMSNILARIKLKPTFAGTVVRLESLFVK